MNCYLKFLVSSITWYWRPNLGVLIGTAIATAVLAGALIVGDSVRFSLRNISSKRLGKASYALESGNKFLTAQLSHRVQKATGITTAGVLYLPGVLFNPDLQEELTGLQIFGIDDDFWQFAKEPEFVLKLSDGEVAINERVADLLELEIGDRILLRLEQPTDYFGDTPLTSKARRIQTLPVTVASILSDEQLGRFGLENNQLIPRNLFINRRYLTSELDVHDRNNIILAQESKSNASIRLTSALSTSLTLEDIGLLLQHESATGKLELSGNSIFIPEVSAKAIHNSNPESEGILTYFVNSIATGTKATPYSFVAGIGRLDSYELTADEIIVSEWLARDLDIRSGDRIRLKYFTISVDNSLDVDSTYFTVSRIIPAKTKQLNSSLTPLFQGLGDAETCFDWDPGIPIDLKLVRPQDEEYWEEFNSTPKALISLSTAQRLWSNRFGSLTAVRFPGNIDADSLEQVILNNVVPTLGYLQFQPVRAEAVAASVQSVDFGQLFIGLSFFILLGSALLIGLLFRYSAELREGESNQMLALGFIINQVKILRLVEAGLISLVGSIVGLGLGILYARSLLYGLGTYWRSAVGFSDFQLVILPEKLLISSVAGTILALVVIWSSLRKLRDKRDILKFTGSVIRPVRFRRLKWSLNTLLLGLIILLVFRLTPSVTENLMIYFLAGMLLLSWATTTTLLIAHEFTIKMSKDRLNGRQLAIANWYRRRGKNLATILMLATGIFVVILVGANYTDPSRDSHLKSSGTGGFDFYAVTSLSYPEQLQLWEDNDGAVISLRYLEGDDASCLNLNLVTQPQVLGVNPSELRGRFSFAKFLPGEEKNSPWDLLSAEQETDIIPAIADQTVLQWGLFKGVGDTLFYLDDHGRRIGLLIVGSLKNSIFQGNMLISESDFVRYFPTSSGYRVFLIDADQKTTTQTTIRKKLANYGPDIITSQERLRDFYAVENTYLLIFLLLGGLGLLISTIGLSTAVVRSTLSNRWELALLQAIGFRWQTITGIVGGEHVFNLCAGVLIGGVSAFLATWPILIEHNSKYPVGLTGLMLTGIILNGLLWIWIGVKISLKDDLIPALSQEN